MAKKDIAQAKNDGLAVNASMTTLIVESSTNSEAISLIRDNRDTLGEFQKNEIAKWVLSPDQQEWFTIQCLGLLFENTKPRDEIQKIILLIRDPSNMSTSAVEDINKLITLSETEENQILLAVIIREGSISPLRVDIQKSIDIVKARASNCSNAAAAPAVSVSVDKAGVGSAPPIATQKTPPDFLISGPELKTPTLPGPVEKNLPPPQ